MWTLFRAIQQLLNSSYIRVIDFCQKSLNLPFLRIIFSFQAELHTGCQAVVKKCLQVCQNARRERFCGKLF